MAKVVLGRLREQTRHYGFYKQASPTGDLIVVRRKVGEPVDYMHTSSQKVLRQRERFALASQHYTSLTPLQRLRLKPEIAEVEYVMRYASEHIKVLQGRQLFISQDIHELLTKNQLKLLPIDCCIRLVDDHYRPLEGDISLLYSQKGVLESAIKTQISLTDFAFSHVPPRMDFYQPTGSAPGFYDPGTTYLKFPQLKGYHYHKLLPLDPLVSWASQWPSLWGGEGGSWYRFWNRIFDPEPYAATVVHSEITLTNYTGDLRIGFGYDNGRYAPTELYAFAIYHVSSSSPQPIHIWTILPAPIKLPDNSYCLCCYQEIPNTEYWLWLRTVYRCGEQYPY